MAAIDSVQNRDPTLFCTFIGGPRDGFRTGDMPESLSGQSLAGMTMRMPLSQPAHFSLFAIYACTDEAQINGFWEFHFVRLEGPDGQLLTVANSDAASQVTASPLT